MRILLLTTNEFRVCRSTHDSKLYFKIEKSFRCTTLVYENERHVMRCNDEFKILVFLLHLTLFIELTELLLVMIEIRRIKRFFLLSVQNMKMNSMKSFSRLIRNGKKNLYRPMNFHFRVRNSMLRALRQI